MQNEFRAFSEAIRSCEELHQHVTLKTYPAKSIVVNEQEHDTCVYFILSGAVKITSFSPQGNEVWHNSHEAGWTFGEMAAISGSPRSATVTTTTNTKLAVISKGHFLDVLSNNPDISMIFLKDMIRRLGIATRLTHELVSMNVATRLAAEFVRRTNSAPNAYGEYPVSPSPSVAEIARQMNLRRETVSKVISICEDEGILRRENRKLIVVNRDAFIDKMKE